MEDSFDEVKQWYDGFCFGKQRDIYNPWSITKYLDTKELKSYWANTSSNQLIAKLLQQGNSDMKVVMEDLLHRKQIEEVLDEEIVFEQLDENENVIKSLYWSKGKTLKKIMWCDDEKIKPYFIAAGKNLTYGNLRRQLTDSLEDKPLPKLSEELQKHTFWEFGSKEEHFKYRNAVMQTYIHGNFPVFEGFNHMQYQIREPEGFARMLETIIVTGRFSNPVVKKA